MTIITWIIIVYLLTVLISWKPIHRSIKEPYNKVAVSPYNPKFVAWFACFIPILNIKLAYYQLKDERRKRKFNKAANEGLFKSAAKAIEEKILIIRLNQLMT